MFFIVASAMALYKTARHFDARQRRAGVACSLRAAQRSVMMRRHYCNFAGACVIC